MGARTRSSTSESPVKLDTRAKTNLSSGDVEPRRLFVLPSHTSQDARFVLLQNPRNGSRTRYYFCPRQGLFEFTKIRASALESGSILLAPKVRGTGPKATNEDSLSATVVEPDEESCYGYINRSSEMFLATLINPVFILLSVLNRSASSANKSSGQRLFQSFDDLIEEPMSDDSHLRHVLTNATFRPKLLEAMSWICDSVDGGDEKMHRLSNLKLYDFLFERAQQVAEKGLPASLEDRFVNRALEVPMPSLKREAGPEVSATESTENVPENSISNTNNQTPAGPSSNDGSTGAGVRSLDAGLTAQLYHLQKLRVAMSFVTTSYLDPTLAATLRKVSGESKVSPDFGPLDKHLGEVARLRGEALAAFTLSDFSKKRRFEDDENAEVRAEKKRKQEEEEKRKKSQESRGVRDLKKVNVVGMKKMSDFFGKNAPIAIPKC
jgi:hypothetical protein